MKECWPPVFKPAPLTARVPGLSGKPLPSSVPNPAKLPHIQAFPTSRPLPLPGVMRAGVTRPPALQRLPSAFPPVIQRQKDDDAKLREALKPFLWSGQEPPDDFFVEEDDDEQGADAPEPPEDPTEENAASGPVQAKLLAPFHPARSGVVQCGKQTPAQLLNKTVGVPYTAVRNVRTAPKKWATRGITKHTHGGRHYYHHREKIGTSHRTLRMEGPIAYHRGTRSATKKTAGKKNGYANGHLIAHSFSGPATFSGNYVAMRNAINSAGGDWGRMETYTRSRLQQKGIAAYMVVKPGYSNTTHQQRPSEIHVSVYFNRSPYKVKFDIDLT